MSTRSPHFVAGFANACMDAGLSQEEAQELWKRADEEDMQKQAASLNPKGIIMDIPRIEVDTSMFGAGPIPEWAQRSSSGINPVRSSSPFSYMSSRPGGARGSINRSHPAYVMQRLGRQAETDRAAAAGLLSADNLMRMNPQQAQRQASRLRWAANRAEKDLLKDYGRYGAEIGQARRHIGKELKYLTGKRDRFQEAAKRQLASRDAEIGTLGGRIRGALGGQWLTNRAVTKAQEYQRQVDEMNRLRKNLGVQ